MENHKYFILYQLIVSVAYLGYIVRKYGVLDSISESFYKLQETHDKNSIVPWVFMLYLINVAWPIHAIIESGWSFGVMAGLLLTGVAARFKDPETEKPHIIGATGGILFAFISLGMAVGGWAWTFMVLQIIVMVILKQKWFPHEYDISYKGTAYIKLYDEIPNYTWWIEISALVLILSAEIIMFT